MYGKIIFYFLSLIVFFLTLIGYLKIAKRFKIFDQPNQRSSHKVVTIRGGGIVFPLAVIFWSFYSEHINPWFILSLMIISIVSLFDDVFSLTASKRIMAQIISTSLLLYGINLLSISPIWTVLLLVAIIGWINAANFMDGINGISALYFISVLLSLYFVNQEMLFVDETLLVFLLLSLIAFSYFNIRKNAKLFAGDIGSVSLAFIIAYEMILLIQQTGKFEYILLLSIYGIDAAITILYRLIRMENILEPHRTHLYQYLANEVGYSHISISLSYALLQLSFNAVLFFIILESEYSLVWALFSVSCQLVIYLVIRQLVMKRISKKLT